MLLSVRMSVVTVVLSTAWTISRVGGFPASSSDTSRTLSLGDADSTWSDGDEAEGSFHAATEAGWPHRITQGIPPRLYQLDPSKPRVFADYGDVTHMWSFEPDDRGTPPSRQAQTPTGTLEGRRAQVMQPAPAAQQNTLHASNAVNEVDAWHHQERQPPAGWHNPATRESNVPAQTQYSEQVASQPQLGGLGHDMPSSLAELQILARARSQARQYGGPDHDLNRLDRIPPVRAQQSHSAVPNIGSAADHHDMTQPFDRSDKLPITFGSSIRSASDNGRQIDQEKSAQDNLFEQVDAQADEDWQPPEGRTVLQERLGSLRFPFHSRYLMPPRSEKARFYGAVRRSSGQGLVRYSADPGLAQRITLARLSGHRLVGSRDVWRKLNLRILFAATDIVAYGVVESQLLKGFFPTLSRVDRNLLPDGTAAIIQIVKAGRRGYWYHLHGVFDPTFLAHLHYKPV